jgi:hypothetical protein
VVSKRFLGKSGAGRRNAETTGLSAPWQQKSEFVRGQAGCSSGTALQRSDFVVAEAFRAAEPEDVLAKRRQLADRGFQPADFVTPQQLFFGAGFGPGQFHALGDVAQFARCIFPVGRPVMVDLDVGGDPVQVRPGVLHGFRIGAAQPQEGFLHQVLGRRPAADARLQILPDLTGMGPIGRGYILPASHTRSLLPRRPAGFPGLEAAVRLSHSWNTK